MLLVSNDVWAGLVSLAVVVVGGGAFAFYLIADARRRKRRDRLLPDVAVKINSAYLPRDDTVLDWFPSRLPFYSTADYAVATHVMRGVLWDVHCIFFDLQAVSNKGDSTSLIEQTVAMFHFGPGGMPAFRLMQWGKDTLFQQFVGMHDRPRLTLRSDPAFSDKFRITTDDEPGVQRLLTARLCRFLDAHDDWDVLSTGTWLAIARPGKLAKIEAYPDFVGETSEVLRAFGTRG